MINKPKIDALIFSLNDVLVDVRLSYRQVVRKAVQVYLEQAVGLQSSNEPLLTPAEVTLLQKTGNFSSYTELTSSSIFICSRPPANCR